jgi:hypothetical protein
LYDQLIPAIEVDASKSAQLVYSVADNLLAHREGVAVVIEVYLDESGTHQNSPIMSVSAV